MAKRIEKQKMNVGKTVMRIIQETLEMKNEEVRKIETKAVKYFKVPICRKSVTYYNRVRIAMMLRTNKIKYAKISIHEEEICVEWVHFGEGKAKGWHCMGWQTNRLKKEWDKEAPQIIKEIYEDMKKQAA